CLHASGCVSLLPGLGNGCAGAGELPAAPLTTACPQCRGTPEIHRQLQTRLTTSRMVNPFKEVNWNPGPRERRKFALSLVICFPCIAMVLLVLGWLRGRGWNLPLAAAVGGGGLGLGLLLLVLPQIGR